MAAAAVESVYETRDSRSSREVSRCQSEPPERALAARRSQALAPVRRWQRAMKNVSPELALVDPDLADAARSGLPETGGYLPPRRPRSPLPDSARDVPPAAARHWADGKAVALSRSGLTAMVLIATLLTLVGTDSIPSDLRRPALTSTPTVSTTKSAAPPSDRGNAARPRTVRVRWAASGRADLYNLVLLRNGKRIDVWPTKNAVTITGTRISGTAKRVTAGGYKWFAYAGFRTGQRVRYGPLIAHGTVRVTPQR